jgi:hypothetical protein
LALQLWFIRQMRVLVAAKLAASLKGSNMTAQGDALGSGPPPWIKP